MALSMDENKTAVNTDQSAATDKTEVITVETKDDAEARISALEAEKLKLIEESANYKLAFLKEKSKQKENSEVEETDEDRIRRITHEELSKTKIAAIDAEKDTLLVKLAKENRELKLAQANKITTPPATFGTHSEVQGVQDTSVTPEQLNAFKAKGWTDKDIERYKKNLKKFGGR